MAPESFVPAAVSQIRAWVREGTIFLSWEMPQGTVEGHKLDGLSGFRVFRRENPIAPGECPTCPLSFQAVAFIQLNPLRGARIEGARMLLEDSSLRPGTEYTYYIVAYNADRLPGPDSKHVTLFWNIPPEAPSLLRARSENRALELSWEWANPPTGEAPSAEEISFNLYRREGSAPFPFYPLNPMPILGTRYLDGGLENGKEYAYQVRAVRTLRNTPVEGPPSTEVKGIPQKTIPPLPPTGVVVTRQEKGVVLRWEENPEPEILGYLVFRREKAGGELVQLNREPLTIPFFLDDSAAPEKSYVYRIQAVDTSPARNKSPFSKEIEVISESPSSPRSW